MSRKPDPSLRARILEEAEHLMHLRGYNGTSLDEIALRCKMTKSNLIHHFHSKEDLGLAVLDFKIGCYTAAFEKTLSGCSGPERAVAELFARAARFQRGNGCRAGCLVGNMALEMSDINERFRERAGRFFSGWAKALERQLRGLKERGCYPPSFDPRAGAEAVLSLYEGSIMLARARRDPSIIARVAKEARRLVSPLWTSKKTKAEESMGPKTPCGC